MERPKNILKGPHFPCKLHIAFSEQNKSLSLPARSSFSLEFSSIREESFGMAWQDPNHHIQNVRCTWKESHQRCFWSNGCVHISVRWWGREGFPDSFCLLRQYLEQPRSHSPWQSTRWAPEYRFWRQMAQALAVGRVAGIWTFFGWGRHALSAGTNVSPK